MNWLYVCPRQAASTVREAFCRRNIVVPTFLPTPNMSKSTTTLMSPFAVGG
jgi:hypothetical protein